MKFQPIAIALVVFATSGASWAGDSKLEAAVGGGVGGALGAVIGDELGDRKGAIIGAGVGAAIGAAIATDDGGADRRHLDSGAVEVRVDTSSGSHHRHGRHCPPGQAKKGRC